LSVVAAVEAAANQVEIKVYQAVPVVVYHMEQLM
jgi:hypothetical protein